MWTSFELQPRRADESLVRSRDRCRCQCVHHFDVEQLRKRPPESFAVERDVRFQDVDAAGIVFYPRVLEYFSDAFVAFLTANGTRLAEVLRERRWGAPLRHAEADYFKPLRYGDRI